MLSTLVWSLLLNQELTPRERELLQRIEQLEARLEAIENRRVESTAASKPPVVPAPTPAPATAPKLNVFFDGYYSWNTNRPADRANPLRAYDVGANSFNINQTGLIVEKEANAEAGSRWGYRLDLMFGQATETLQGSPANENRPFVYRHLFQAYGTYQAPIGRGLTLDFGKWASALGPEGNYTKDQINYSRSYFFNFLPFYHMGLRATYPIHDRISATYWLVNGANQTEDFNGFKSQLGQVVVKPARNLIWTVNYYNGREQREAGSPARAPRGRFHVVDTYVSWALTPKLTLGGEFDYVVSRVESNSPAQRIVGGAGYLRYQIHPKLYFGQRYVRLNDRGGLFSGQVQNLNDFTSTIGFRPGDGFETRFEFRRDLSNSPFFMTRTPGVLSKHQDTITVGLLWWFGEKAGGW